MAVTVTNVRTTAEQLVADVEATADADVAAVIPHGLQAAPSRVTLVPLAAEFYVSNWYVGVVDATNVNLVCTNAVGSGAVGDQVRVLVDLSYSPPVGQPVREPRLDGQPDGSIG